MGYRNPTWSCVPGAALTQSAPLPALPQKVESRVRVSMPVLAVAEDKPKIAFYGAMMAIQNFGFFVMYYRERPAIDPGTAQHTSSKHLR